MTPERWTHINEVFHAALDMPPSGRAAFLESACAGDESLRRNVERMLAAESEPSLPSPAPHLLHIPDPDLTTGETLLHYRVEAKVGEGGMGAVYRCYDTRLHRQVALKVLSFARFSDAEGKRRLLREARAASALTHANIVTIYEVGSDRGVDFIAMEYVEGQTLDKLIGRAGLPVPLVLRYASQIAGALARAHDAGVLHRDLKPANIIVTADHQIKLLDFGLACAATPAADDDSSFASQEGMLIGTPPYMSPEQADGGGLDARSDVFSMGSVLYEMATGQRPFAGKSRLEVLSEIVKTDPVPPSKLAAMPAGLEKVILRCLRKDASARYQSASAIKEDLEALEKSESASPVSRVPRFARPAVLVAAVVLIGILALRLARPPSPEAPLHTVKFTITPANLMRGGDTEIDAEVSLSPDGKHIAYVESPAGQLWIRDIDQEQARPVQGATGVYQSFWAPDNLSLGYTTGRLCGARPGCDLVRIPVQGGTPTVITKLQGAFRRASFSPDGKTIVFCDTGGLYTVSSNGGPVTRVQEHRHIEHPSFLPIRSGRSAILYQAVDSGSTAHRLYVQRLGEPAGRPLLTSSSSNPYPVYSPTGHIIYVDGERDAAGIWAVPFSVDTLEATGKPFVVAAHGSSPVVSQSGTLVFSDVPSDRRQLVWADRTGKTLSTIGDPQRQLEPTLSPDGRRLLVHIFDTQPDLWIYDLERNKRSRLTNDRAMDLPGAWSRTGEFVAYTSRGASSLDAFYQAVSGTGAPVLVAGTGDRERVVDWSSNDRFLLIERAPAAAPTSDLIYRERLSGDLLGPVQTLLNSRFNEWAAQFSPDGNHLVYVSDETGENEVYVCDFPRCADKRRISVAGGMAPRWRSPNEITYVHEGLLMSVNAVTRPALSFAAPVKLFAKRSLFAPYPSYDVTGDGKRFILLDKPADGPPLAIHVVHNWFEEFRAGAGKVK